MVGGMNEPPYFPTFFISLFQLRNNPKSSYSYPEEFSLLLGIFSFPIGE
jgi:hypothetical protein